MREIVTEVVKVNTAGEDGAAVGSAKSPSMLGLLLDIAVDYHASAPATTDLAIKFQNGFSILAVANNATDALYAPRQTCVGADNSPITNSYDRFPLSGQLSVEVAGCNELDSAVEVTFRYLRL